MRTSSEAVIECNYCHKRFAIEWAVGSVSTPRFCPFCGEDIEELYSEVERQVDD